MGRNYINSFGYWGKASPATTSANYWELHEYQNQKMSMSDTSRPCSESSLNCLRTSLSP